MCIRDSLKAFETKLGIGFAQKVDLQEFLDMIGDGVKSDKLNKILLQFGSSMEEFIEYWESEDNELKDYIDFNPKTQKVRTL